MSQDDQRLQGGARSDDSLLSILSRHPEYVIPGLSLWLFLVAKSYLAGYLVVYLVPAHWFNPSVFSLVAVSSDAVLLALGLCALAALLLHLSWERRRWWVIGYLAWAAILVYVGSRVYTYVDEEYGIARPWVSRGSISTFLIWMAVPIAWHVSAGRFLRRRNRLYETAEELAAVRRENAASPSPESTKRIEELETRGKSLLRSMTPRTFGFGMRAMEMIALGAIAYVVLDVVYWLGFAKAKQEASVLQEVRSISNVYPEMDNAMDALVAPVANRVIFTDGNAILARKRINDDDVVVYRASPDGDEFPVTTISELLRRMLHARDR